MSSETKKDEAESGPPKDGVEGVFSLDDLDKIIEAEDPGFKSEMEGLKAAGGEASPVAEDLGISTDDDELIKDEDIEKLSRIKKIRLKISRIVEPIPAKVWLKILSLKNRVVHLTLGVLSFFRHDFVEYTKYLFSRLKQYSFLLRTELIKFKNLSRTKQITLVSLFILLSVGSLLLVNAIRGAGLPRWSQELPLSFAQRANYIGSYQDASDLQDFYQAFPEVEFHVLLKKIVVNLRSSPGFGSNPMGAFEIFLALDSQDTAVEVKDREKEVIDLIQRTLENFKYEQVVTQVGKVRMKEAIKESVNAILNQGAVFNVYFNLFVTYQ